MSWFFHTPSKHLVTRVHELETRVGVLERERAMREGEWADTLDRFESLYRRFAARQDRARRSATGLAETVATDEARAGSGESPLSLRQRLGRR